MSILSSLYFRPIDNTGLSIIFISTRLLKDFSPLIWLLFNTNFPNTQINTELYFTASVTLPMYFSLVSNGITAGEFQHI